MWFFCMMLAAHLDCNSSLMAITTGVSWHLCTFCIHPGCFAVAWITRWCHSCKLPLERSELVVWLSLILLLSQLYSQRIKTLLNLSAIWKWKCTIIIKLSYIPLWFIYFFLALLMKSFSFILISFPTIFNQISFYFSFCRSHMGVVETETN